MHFRFKAFHFLTGFLAGATILFLINQTRSPESPTADGFSSATPLALRKTVPEHSSLLISGQVKHNWALKAKEFEKLAQTRLRCIENDPSGIITGAYIYQGVPILHILEGVQPQNRPDDPFDRPLDMVVLAENALGQSSWFSYGELTMCSDDQPVLIAIHREELLPSKDPEKYQRNSWHGPQKGLRFIASRDHDNSRHIDAVSDIQLLRPEWSTPEGTPDMKTPGKGAPVPDELILGENAEVIWTGRPGTLDLSLYQIDNWRRIGHGRGLKSQKPEHLTGYRLADFLLKMFPGIRRDDAILVVAIDGYRILFSGREIFEHDQGQGLLLQESTETGQGWCIQATGDFFVDRCVWGVSHVIRIPASDVQQAISKVSI